METAHEESLGIRLRRYRRAAGIGQAALARRCKVTPGHYWKVEHDKANPSPLLLDALAAVLGIDPDELVGEDVAA